ncbi:MAG: FtsX-like permease family protein [Spirochaetaceae bacterium]|nr:MAG: FtsX-like permease family protein [Spirochaetaceae bacterium]
MLSLALRNVVRHGRHTALLAALFALASLLFIAGNSLLTHANRTLRTLFVHTITGDFVVAAPSDVPTSLFGATTPSIGELITLPLLSRLPLLTAELGALPEVERVTPLVSGAAVLDLPGRRLTVPIFGIEPAGYFAALPGIEVVAGRALQPGESGIMLTERLVRRIEAETGRAVNLGDELLLTAAQGQRFRIRSAALVGLFRYPVSMDFSDEIALVDAATVLALNEIQRFTPETNADAGGAAGALSGPTTIADVDDLFADVGISDDAVGEANGLTVDDVLARVMGPVPRPTSGDEPVGTSVLAPADAPIPVDAHFLLVRGRVTPAVRDRVATLGGEILSWRQAAGQTALLALLLLIAFNGGFVIFLLAVSLAAANIVLISTYRRTREIATLRAVGAELPLVRRIFVLEHAVIGAAGWLLGLGGTVVLSLLLAHREILVGNRLVATVIGGHRLRLPVDAGTVALCLLVVTAIAAGAVAVPLRQVIRKPIVEAIRER